MRQAAYALATEHFDLLARFQGFDLFAHGAEVSERVEKHAYSPSPLIQPCIGREDRGWGIVKHRAAHVFAAAAGQPQPVPEEDGVVVVEAVAEKAFFSGLKCVRPAKALA